MRVSRLYPLLVQRASVIAVCCLFLSPAISVFGQGAMEFTCKAAARANHASTLTATTRYLAPAAAAANDEQTTPATFGFDLIASPVQFTRDSCSSDKPFFFSVAVPDGNYQVSLTMGGPTASTTTVRAESRRLFVDRQTIRGGGSARVVFNVNVRSATIAQDPTARVKLKPREIGALDWDEKLTLEFNGTRPSVRSISIRPIHNVPTIYLAGDSTVVDQDKEPWAAWGQMLPVFFGPDVAIANEAESGETIRSFTGERRFEKILSTIRPGDYLMIQFAHNDQKQGSPAATDFKGDLRRSIDAMRTAGATPMLVTSMNRRTFDAEGKITDSLGGYPQAMREVAKEENVPLIDLNAMSKVLFETMGPDGTLKAFVHYPANTFTGQTAELKDDTHFNGYGAYELARAVVQAIEDQKLPLAPYLRKDIPPFHPAAPDDVATFVLPQSPLVSTEKPYGR